MKTTTMINGLNSSSLEPFKYRDWLILPSSSYEKGVLTLLEWHNCPLLESKCTPLPNTHTHTHPTHLPLPQQCVLHFYVCMRPMSCLSGDKSGLLWTRKFWQTVRMTGRGHDPILQVPRKASIPLTPRPSDPVPPHSTGLAADGGASLKTASFAKLIVYYDFHCCF